MNNLEIKKIRKELRKTQSEFAELLGVGERAVQTWESGERNISQSALLLLKMILKYEHRDTVHIINEPENDEDIYSNATNETEKPLQDIVADKVLEKLEPLLKKVELQDAKIGEIVLKLGLIEEKINH